jgi:hypothetical protein
LTTDLANLKNEFEHIDQITPEELEALFALIQQIINELRFDWTSEMEYAKVNLDKIDNDGELEKFYFSDVACEVYHLIWKYMHDHGLTIPRLLPSLEPEILFPEFDSDGKRTMKNYNDLADYISAAFVHQNLHCGETL